jgi:hypothetical protein
MVRQNRWWAGIRRVLKIRDIPRGIKQISSRRSDCELLIQIADHVVVSILRRGLSQDTVTFEMIAIKIKQILLYEA